MVTAEAHPTFRVDVSALFGKYLPVLGIRTRLVAATLPKDAAAPWGGGATALSVGSLAPVRRHSRVLLHAAVEAWLARRNGCRAIQVRDMPVTAAVVLAIAKWKGLPFYYWMSFPKPEGQIQRARERGLRSGVFRFLVPWIRGRLWRFVLYQVVAPRASHLFVQSERMREDMIARGVRPTALTVVPMGVDIDDFQTVSVRPKDHPKMVGRRSLVYLGTQEQARRIDLLFDVLLLVKRLIPSVLLVLVGDAQDPEHRQWLRAEAARRGLADDVLWTGWLPLHEGWQYVSAAEVGLSPFPRGPVLDSASPTKILEYLMLGVPVVCNDNPDQAMLVRESRGGTCVPLVVDQFADAIVKLLKMSGVQRAEIAASGRRYVIEQRGYSKIAADLARVYRSLAAAA